VCRSSGMRAKHQTGEEQMRRTDEKALTAKGETEVVITSHLTTHFLQHSLMTST